MKTVKKSLLLCLFFFALIKINKVTGQSRFAIAPTIGAIQGNIPSRNYFNMPASHDKGYGLLIGLMGHYFLNPRWTISTGVNYHRINLYTRTLDERKEKLNFWNVPVLLNYKPILHTFSPYFSAGAVLSSRSTYSTKLPTALDIIIGAGVAYKPGSRVSWIIQPVWQKEVAPKPSKLIPSKYQLYKISLQIQMLFHL